jgi:RNA polymerase sigma factor (sigma-70 family)
VDEVAVRTHERALASLARFDTARGQFSTWLNWLARSVASRVRADWYGPRFTAFDEDLHARYVPTLPGPEELHARQARDEEVRQAYEALDREGRLTMFYHDLSGMSFAATAAELGWSVKRVRYARNRAMRQMRHRLHSLGQIRR